MPIKPEDRTAAIRNALGRNALGGSSPHPEGPPDPWLVPDTVAEPEPQMESSSMSPPMVPPKKAPETPAPVYVADFTDPAVVRGAKPPPPGKGARAPLAHQRTAVAKSAVEEGRQKNRFNMYKNSAPFRTAVSVATAADSVDPLIALDLSYTDAQRRAEQKLEGMKREGMLDSQSRTALEAARAQKGVNELGHEKQRLPKDIYPPEGKRPAKEVQAFAEILNLRKDNYEGLADVQRRHAEKLVPPAKPLSPKPAGLVDTDTASRWDLMQSTQYRWADRLAREGRHINDKDAKFDVPHPRAENLSAGARAVRENMEELGQFLYETQHLPRDSHFKSMPDLPGLEDYYESIGKNKYQAYIDQSHMMTAVRNYESFRSGTAPQPNYIVRANTIPLEDLIIPKGMEKERNSSNLAEFIDLLAFDEENPEKALEKHRYVEWIDEKDAHEMYKYLKESDARRREILTTASRDRLGAWERYTDAVNVQKEYDQKWEDYGDRVNTKGKLSREEAELAKKGAALRKEAGQHYKTAWDKTPTEPPGPSIGTIAATALTIPALALQEFSKSQQFGPQITHLAKLKDRPLTSKDLNQPALLGLAANPGLAKQLYSQGILSYSLMTEIRSVGPTISSD